MTTTFERNLSERLEAAAALAPEFHEVASPAPRRRPSGSRGPRRWRRLVVAAAAIVVVAGGITVGVNLAGSGSGGTTTGGTASCAAVVEFQGRTYFGRQWTRLPQRGESLGTAHAPSCDDGGTPTPSRALAAYAIPGVPVDQGLLANHTLWVARDATSRLLTSQRLTEPVVCQATGSFHATGTLRSVFDSQGRPAADLAGTESVTARFDLTEGPEWLIDGYQEVVADATVTDTTGGDHESVLRAAPNDAARVTVELRCHGSDFLLTAISLAN